jgi:uncharacterized membrane protein YphA (DoxX/SURF4 family)
MLNPFPSLLVYSTLAPLILRLALGLVFLDLGYFNLKMRKVPLLYITGFLEVAGAIMLFFGYYTQIAALGFALLTGIELYIEWKNENILKGDLVFYLLLFAISLSLLLSGAGAFAKDLPL